MLWYVVEYFRVKLWWIGLVAQQQQQNVYPSKVRLGVVEWFGLNFTWILLENSWFSLNFELDFHWFSLIFHEFIMTFHWFSMNFLSNCTWYAYARKILLRKLFRNFVKNIFTGYPLRHEILSHFFMFFERKSDKIMFFQLFGDNWL